MNKIGFILIETYHSSKSKSINLSNEGFFLFFFKRLWSKLMKGSFVRTMSHTSKVVIAIFYHLTNRILLLLNSQLCWKHPANVTNTAKRIERKSNKLLIYNIVCLGTNLVLATQHILCCVLKYSDYRYHFTRKSCLSKLDIFVVK